MALGLNDPSGGIAGYLAGEDASRQRQLRQLAQGQALMGILSAARAQQDAPLKSALLRAQVAEHEQKVRQAEMMQGLLGKLQSGGGITKLTPDQINQLGVLGAIGGHSGMLALSERMAKEEEAKTADRGILSALRGPETPIQRDVIPAGTDQANTDAALLARFNAMPPGPKSVTASSDMSQDPTLRPTLPVGGAFSTLFNSKLPSVAQAAQDYQDRVNSPSPSITGKNAQEMLKHLTDRQSSYEQAMAGRQTTADNKPQYSNIQSDGKGGFVGLNKDTNRIEAVPSDARGKITIDPRVEQLYKDYATNPVVKTANDLEPKIRPLVGYMNNLAKTGKSLNVYDESLVKTYLAVTSSAGSRSYVLDRKALAALPNVGDRFGNAISSFASGKDLTDTTRNEMWDYIKSTYRAAASARDDHRGLIESRARVLGIPANQIFGEQK